MTDQPELPKFVLAPPLPPDASDEEVLREFRKCVGPNGMLPKKEILDRPADKK